MRARFRALDGHGCAASGAMAGYSGHKPECRRGRKPLGPRPLPCRCNSHCPARIPAARCSAMTGRLPPRFRWGDRFFENALFGGTHQLKNRYMHVDWVDESEDVDLAMAQQVTQQVERLLSVLDKAEMSLREIMEQLALSDRNNVMKNYVNPVLELGLIERTVPNKPNSRHRSTGRLSSSKAEDTSRQITLPRMQGR